jgi:hypothetical protein
MRSGRLPLVLVATLFATETAAPTIPARTWIG